jgi:hypothetical protein
MEAVTAQLPMAEQLTLVRGEPVSCPWSLSVAAQVGRAANRTADAAHGARCCVLHAACRRMLLPVAAACMSAFTWLESRPQQVLDARIASTTLAPSATRANWPSPRSAT